VKENLSNVASQDSRLAAAVNGSGTKNPNFSIGQGTSFEANQLGKIWIGDDARPISGVPGGFISADGARVYRPPAGIGGFDVYVGKHTQLDGAVIASDAEAAKNKLSTETFGFTDLQNKAAYKSTTVGLNLGMSGAFDVANKGGANGLGPSGLSLGHTSGSASGTTYAAIAPGTIEVRSDKDSGRDSTAGLSRDTAGANGSIGQIFDKDKVREQLEFQQAFGQLGMQIAGMS